MTERDRILSLTDEELTKEVAEKVMGWHWEDRGIDGAFWATADGFWGSPGGRWYPLADEGMNADCWQVVTAIQAKGWRVVIDTWVGFVKFIREKGLVKIEVDLPEGQEQRAVLQAALIAVAEAKGAS